MENVGEEDYHQLMRAWELKHRAITSQCVTQHTLFLEETRWPGYYYRGDHLKLDDENWHCLTVSRRDPKTGKLISSWTPAEFLRDRWCAGNKSNSLYGRGSLGWQNLRLIISWVLNFEKMIKTFK